MYPKEKEVYGAVVSLLVVVGAGLGNEEGSTDQLLPPWSWSLHIVRPTQCPSSGELLPVYTFITPHSGQRIWEV